MGQQWTVTVTATDVANGRERAAKGCPVYLACVRDVGDAVRAVRGDGTIVLRSRRDRFGADALVRPADLVRDAVQAFDQGLGMHAPFTFTVEYPS